MKKTGSLLAALFVFISAIAGAQKGDNGKSLLWRISGNGLAVPSYLFGTIHLICPDDYVWTDKMKKGLAASDKVCFEMDLDDPAVLSGASGGFMDTTGKKLKDYYTAEQYQQLKKFVKDSVGMDITMFSRMKPIALQSVIEMKTTKCADAVSYEQRIMELAHKDNKEIIGLEQVEEQISVLETMPDDTVAKSILDDVKDFSTSRMEYAELVAAYKKQDLPELYAKITTSKDMAESMAAFLDDRNKKWIPRMTEKMKTSSVFFAVGAGHLWGDNGVINLLRKGGYTVEMVK